jgi:predicted glycogen debranching enzyme
MVERSRDNAPVWELGREVLADFARATTYEWLETNGLGGWASSSVVGAHTRRYHGLLVAATEPPAGRRVLLSRLDETLRIGDRAWELSCNAFPGAIHPRGHEFLTRFEEELFPEWEYAAGPWRLRKTIAAIDGESTTVVVYELLEAPSPVTLELRPFFAGRDYHALASAASGALADAELDESTLAYRMHDEEAPVHLLAPGAAYTPSPGWYFRFEYARERERGFDFQEDLFTPGALAVTLRPGERIGVIASLLSPRGRDALALLDGERRRRLGLLRPFAGQGELVRSLVLAADQFLVRRAADWTVIAGYPWFADWGRDTMIALPGLALATGRLDAAAGILRAFAGAVRHGLLPNRFSDRGEEPEYNTVDASLWFFVAVWRFLAAGGDPELVRRALLPALREIESAHRRGTLHGIHEAEDGLLASGEPGLQLTWMDARVGDRVVTPRRGKPVEIQALWTNALQILADLEERFGDGIAAAPLRARAKIAANRFAELFWSPERGYLFDVVDGQDRDPSLRPNQLLALSLPFPLVEGERAESILKIVEERLLTPRGLRTLAPDDPRYCPRYAGGPAERDGAYHQGTVWPWLLGPYVDALLRVRGEAGREAARAVLEGFAPHLHEAGIGTISEVFDAEAPQLPGGCIAQAWSVSELLRVALALADSTPNRRSR